MSDRNQSWVITADFTRLIQQSNQAARAIRKLDEARNDANKNANKKIVGDTEKESSALDKLDQALREAAQSRKEYNRQMSMSGTRTKKTADATLEAALAQHDYNDSLRDHSSAAAASAAASKNAAAGVNSHTRSLRSNTSAARANSSATARGGRAMSDSVRNAKRLSAEVTNMTGRLGYVNRAIQSTANHSRSWGLIMKMLPLTALTSGINALTPAIAGLGGAFIGLMGTLGPVFGILGAFPGVLAGIAGAVGGIVSGVAGIGGAFSKYRKFQEAQTKSQSKAAAKQQKDEKAKLKSVRTAERSLTKAQKSQRKALEDIAEAEAGVADAAEDNARRIRDAQRAVVDAQDRVRDSQKGVTQARLDAAKAIQEYRDKLRGAILDEESASQSLESARAAAARVALDPGATDLERRAADLAVRQAEAQLDEVRKTGVALEREAQDAAKKGVENADIVVAAKEAEIDANQSLADAQEGLSDAHKQAARNTQNANDAVEDAKVAYADAGERVVELTEDLTDLRTELEEVRKGTGDAASQLEEYEAALAKLPPSAQAVVQELIALSEAWEKVSYRAQDAISPGLLKALQDLRQKLLPPIADFLERMAGGAGRFAGAFTGLLSSRFGLDALNDIFADGYDLMGLLGEATLNVTTWLLGLGKAARRSGLTRWIGEAIRSWTDGWAKATATPEGLTNTVAAFQDTMHYTELWGRAIGDTWRFLRTFFRSFRPLGEWMLDNISETMTRWDQWAKSDSGEEKIRVWQDLAKINLAGIADTIRTITSQGVKMFDGIDFQRVWDALNGTEGENNGLINALGDLLGIVTEDMIVNIFNLGESIAGVLQAFGEGGGMEGVTMFVDALGGLVSIVDWLVVNVPGLSKILGIFLGVFATKKFIEATSSIFGVTDAVGAATAVKAKGYDTKQKGYLGAYTKQYLGFGAFNADLTDPDQNAAYMGSMSTKETIKSQRKSQREQRKAYRQEVREYRKQQRALKAGTLGPRDTTYARTAKAPVAPTGGARVPRVGGGVGSLLKAAGGLGLLLMVLEPIGALLESVTANTPGLEGVATALDRLSKTNFDNFKPLDEIFMSKDNASVAVVDGINGIDDALAYTKRSFTTWDAQLGSWLAGAASSMTGHTVGVEKIKQAYRDLDTELAKMDPQEASKVFREIAERAENADLTTDELIRLFPQLATATRQSLEDANSSIAGYKASNEDIVKLMKGEVVEGFTMTSDGAIVAADSVEALADEQKKAAERADAFAAAQREQKADIDASIDGYKAAKDAVKELNDAQREGASVSMDAEAAQADYSATLREASAVREESGGRWRTADNTAFDVTEEGGAANAEYFRNLATAARDNADAMLANGSSVEEVNAKMRVQRDEFIKALGLFDITGQAAQDYADRLAVIPNYTGTEVVLENGNITQAEIKKIEDQLKNFDVDTQHEIKIEAVTNGFESAQGMIDAIKKEADIPIKFHLDEKAQADIWNRKPNKYVIPARPHEDIWSRKPHEYEIKRKAAGGPISGPGTATSDSIPALLSDGEYVVRAKSAALLGQGRLDYLNRTGRLPRFATGGFVGGGAPTLSATSRVPIPARAQSLFGEFAVELISIQESFNAVSGFTHRWGVSFNTWWNKLWAGLLGTQDSAGASMVSGVSSILTRVITAVGLATPTLGAAWTTFMAAQKTPIIEAIKFVNDTLGAVVSTVAKYYGVTDTPFPVKVPGFSEGGWTGPGSKYQPAGVVHADEFVVNKSARRNIESTSPGLLDYMNRNGRVPGYATGGRVRPITGPESRNYSGHSGIDYKAAEGTPVRAADDGRIEGTIRKRTSYGIHIVQRLAQGLKAVYAHLSGFNVVPGQDVQAGQVIGRSGNSGNSTGAHLHFEVGTSFGAAGNRNFTRAWLGGASAILADGGPLADAFDALSPLKDMAVQAATLTQTLANGSGWGGLVGKVVESLAGMPLKKLEGMDLAGQGATGNFGTGSQRDNAFGIIDVAMRRGLGHRGALLGLMTAMQESSLVNIRGGDRDSLGLFQQRPSMGWGTPSQIMDPVYSANKFYDALVKKPTWGAGPEWEDIQSVQISAFPTAYQKHKGRALQYLAEWAQARGAGFARGGWTGPGSKHQPAGVVHADEYVINKDSRRRIERMSPGLLDYLNSGNFSGYADGGVVKGSAVSSAAKKTAFPVPAGWKDFKVFLSYLRKAESYDPKNPTKPLGELRNHVRFVEELLAYEGGLMWRKDITGRWGPKHVEAWKAWQKRNDMVQSGKVDDSSLAALMKKHGVSKNYEPALPYVPGLAQPSRLDVLQSSMDTSNKQMSELTGYINKFKAMGMTDLADKIKELGPTGIPEELRDSINPLNGLQLAREYSKNTAAARKYNESLKKANQFSQQASATQSKMDEMLALLQYGENSPYGLESLARELGISMDTAVVVYRKLLANGSLKGVAANRTSRLRGDVVDFDNLFKFSKGGIVPGVGDVDKVHALLTPGEMVIPKDVVQSMFRASAPLTSAANYSVNAATRKSGTGGAAPTVFQFNTNVHNPVAETAADSVQKRVRSVAALGLLGGTRAPSDTR